MISTVGELKELLEDFDDDAQLRVAYQPGYPLAAQLQEVTRIGGTLWLAASSGVDYDESPYAPAEAFTGLDFDEIDEDLEEV